MKGKDSEIRLNTLLEAVKRGRNAEDAYSILPPPVVNGGITRYFTDKFGIGEDMWVNDEYFKGYSNELNRDKGREFEERVAQVLNDIPDVAMVKQAEPNSIYDISGVDLVAFFYPDRGVSLVQIQVKSSRRTNKFSPGRYRRRLGNLTEEEFRKWCLDHNFMFLRGNKEAKQIRADFLAKLAQIEDYHRNKAK